MHIYKLLFIVYSNFFLIIPILHPILNILTLLSHQALLASLLKIIDNINSCNIILNLTQLFSISIKIRECLNNIIVKNIKGILLFRPRLLKPKDNNKSLLKIKKLTLI